MKFRIMTEADRKAIQWLWAYCFESYEPFFSWYFREYYQTGNTLGAFENEKLLSCLQLIPYKILLRGQVLSSSYIVGLASYPEARRGGIIKKLLQTSLEEMRCRDHAVSLLMPSEAGFYYPYQWQFCYHHYKYHIPLEDLRPVSEHYGIFIRVEGLEKVDDFNRIYRAFVKNKHGYVIRSSKNWRLLFEEHKGEKGYTYLLENQGVPEGYVMYYLKDNKLLVREMAYTSVKAQKSLFQFLYNHRSQVETLEWNASFDDTTHFFLPNPKKGITLYPFLMARIVDVQRALTLISYPEGVQAEIILTIEDDLASWNNQTFSLNICNQQAEVYPVSKEPTVAISIGALSQLLFGILRARDILYQGRLKAKNLKEVKILDEIFPVCNNYINEYY